MNGAICPIKFLLIPNKMIEIANPTIPPIKTAIVEGINIKGAKSVLLNVTGSSNLTMQEINEGSNIIFEAAGEEANVIFGCVRKEEMNDAVSYTVIATGFDGAQKGFGSKHFKVSSQKENDLRSGFSFMHNDEIDKDDLEVPTILRVQKPKASFTKKEEDEDPQTGFTFESSRYNWAKEKSEKKNEKSKGEDKPESKPDKDGDESDDGEETRPEQSSEWKDGPNAKEDEMLSEQVDEKKDGESEFDKHVHDVHSLINEEIKDAIKEEKVTIRKNPEGREFATSGYIPFSTRFDKVTDHSGKGSVHNYASLKHEVKSIVAPIKHDLERILKVKENAKWRVERERGSVNSKSLSKLLTDKNYRTPFKEFHKVETNNVAVQLLVDMSGSMAGKIHIAQMAVVAMAEALKSLDIPFEVTGFHSTLSRELYAHTGARDDRFGRTQEMLDLHVFKRFDCPTLYAIEKIKSGHNNPDGECVVWAAKRLAERKEKRKILLVLSDGYPNTNDTDTTRLNQDLRLKVGNIIKSGIEVVGVGITTDAVRHFYPEYIVINDLDKLPSETMKKLSKILVR